MSLDTPPTRSVPFWRRQFSFGPVKVPLLAAVLLAIGLLWLSWDIAASKLCKVQVPGLRLVTIGMTRAEVTSLLGSPRKATATVMRKGIYGVPERMEEQIGNGNAFEMWQYERRTSSKSLSATVWFGKVPARSPNDLRVVAITTQVVASSLQHRYLNTLARLFPWLRLDD